LRDAVLIFERVGILDAEEVDEAVARRGGAFLAGLVLGFALAAAAPRITVSESYICSGAITRISRRV